MKKEKERKEHTASTTYNYTILFIASACFSFLLSEFVDVNISNHYDYNNVAYEYVKTRRSRRIANGVSSAQCTIANSTNLCIQ